MASTKQHKTIGVSEDTRLVFETRVFTRLVRISLPVVNQKEDLWRNRTEKIVSKVSVVYIPIETEKSYNYLLSLVRGHCMLTECGALRLDLRSAGCATDQRL